ncbi:MAG: LysR family transcriptional regulator [Pseudomonadota bacterium]
MDLKQLRYFVAVAEIGNIGAAAKKLHISQPPVTRQIQKLEDEIGADLFTRTPRGVELTDAGRALLEEARDILDRTDRAILRSRSAHLGEIGNIDIGFMGSPIYSTLPRVLRHFRLRQPKVSIALHRMGKQEQIDAIRNDRLHVGTARFFSAEPDLSSVQVSLEVPMLAVSDRTLRRTKEIRLSELRDRPLILFPSAGRPNFADTVMEVFKAQRLKPRIGHTAEDLTAALALTACGAGYCLVPATVAELRWPGIRFVHLARVKPIIPVHCIYRTDDTSPVLRSFLDALSQYIAENRNDER